MISSLIILLSDPDSDTVVVMSGLLHFLRMLLCLVWLSYHLFDRLHGKLCLMLLVQYLKRFFQHISSWFVMLYLLQEIRSVERKRYQFSVFQTSVIYV